MPHSAGPHAEPAVAMYRCASPAATHTRWSGRSATRGKPAVRHTPDAWRSSGRPSSPRPPPGQRAARLQLVHLRVEQFVLHQQLTDLGLQPTMVVVPGIRRPALQARLPGSQKLIAPLRGPCRRDPHRPRHRLEILPAQQTQYHLALPPDRKPTPATGGDSNPATHVAVGSTCGHLPKIVARRVRWRLPPPPPSLVGARTPGSLGAHSRFSLCFWGDCTALGRAAKEVRRVRGEVVAGVPEIVSRARFRGPGCARVSPPPPRGRRTSDRASARPNTVPLPVRRCADGSRIPLDPSYVPEYPGSKLLIAGIQAGWLGPTG